RIDELLRRFVRLVAVEDSCGLLDLLRERAIGARGPVGGAAAAHRARGVLPGYELSELERDSRLADPGRAEHRDEVTPAPLDDALPDSGEHAQFAIAPDHGHRCESPLAD